MKKAHVSGEISLDATLQRIHAKAISSIMQNADADAELLAILTKHIVTLAPNTDAVEQAVSNIKNLAKERTEA